MAILSLVALAVLPATRASGDADLSLVNATLRNACEHPSAATSTTVPATATWRIERSNLFGYPRNFGSSPDLALFSRGTTLYDCLISSNHVSPVMTNAGVARATSQLTTTRLVSGIAGVLLGGYTTNKDTNTATVWVSGIVAPSVKAVTLHAYFGQPCRGFVQCAEPLFDAGSAHAVMVGRYFLASRIVAYSAGRPHVELQVEGTSAKGIVISNASAASLVMPTTFTPVTTSF